MAGCSARSDQQTRTQTNTNTKQTHAHVYNMEKGHQGLTGITWAVRRRSEGMPSPLEETAEPRKVRPEDGDTKTLKAK